VTVTGNRSKTSLIYKSRYITRKSKKVTKTLGYWDLYPFYNDDTKRNETR